MDFPIADTFTDGLARLTGEEQKAVKTTAFDLQMDTSVSGMQLHRIHRAKDRGFCSVRVSQGVRQAALAGGTRLRTASPGKLPAIHNLGRTVGGEDIK